MHGDSWKINLKKSFGAPVQNNNQPIYAIKIKAVLRENGGPIWN